MPEVRLDYGEDVAGDKAWRLHEEGELTNVYPTKGPGKKAAKRAAEKLVNRDGYAELVIYKKDGMIQNRKTLTRDDTNSVGGGLGDMLGF